MTLAARTDLLLGLCLMSLCALTVSGQERVRADLEPIGSVPPIPGLYDCVHRLDGKPYTEQTKDLARACLSHILATNYFELGKIKENLSNEGVPVFTFVLKAPPLVVVKMELQTDTEDRQKLEEWLSKDENNLHLGAAYGPLKELATKAIIRQYFLSLGRAVGVSSSIELDYATRTSSLKFAVTEGPRVATEPVVPPYGNPCDDGIMALDWSNVDQYVAIPLVRDLVKIRDAGSCFSKEAVLADRVALEQSALFKGVKVMFSGPPGYRQVSFRLRGKPLTVDAITVRGYGLLDRFPDGSKINLPLKQGQVYTSKLAEESQGELARLYSRPGWRIEVFEHDEVCSGQQLCVTFGVLAFGDDELLINGRRVLLPLREGGPDNHL
jgi:hypothetical protein